MESIVTLISQVGFPIACCVYLFTQQNKLIGTLGEISTTLALMNQRIEDERRATDSLSISMMNSLHKIELTVTEIKTKIDIKSNKDADIKEE